MENEHLNYTDWAMPLHSEIHARPAPIIDSPSRIFYFSISNEGLYKEEVKESLGQKEGIDFISISNDLKTYKRDQEEIWLNFHNEYVGLLIIFHGYRGNSLFEREHLIERVDFYKDLIPGKKINSNDIVLLKNNNDPFNKEGLAKVFGDLNIVGSQVADSELRMWSKFELDEDGYIKILLEDINSDPFRNGRTIQRIADIEAYRILSLKGLPIARELIPQINTIDEKSQDFLEALNHETIDDVKMLERLMSLSADAEKMRANYASTYSAITAYQDIVERRLNEIRETRIHSFTLVSEFLLRALIPGYRTSNSVHKRIHSLIDRINGATDLLRTKVNVHLEIQNQKILKSFDDRSESQLHIQKTVEGLSIIALTYYGLGLIKIMLKGLKSMGLPINPDMGVVIFAPILIICLWRFSKYLSVQINTKD
jgi:uncharacterized membrane-anchored protein